MEQIIICPHLKKRGICYYGEECKFIHPPDLVPERPFSDPHVNEARTYTEEGKTKRRKRRNWSKVGIFRRFLIDTFGRELLTRGIGVLDIAGGNGQLGFELVNLSNIPCTIIDPRKTKLDHYKKRLLLGMYWSNPIFQKYNFRSFHEALKTGPIEPLHFRIFFNETLWKLEELTENQQEEEFLKNFQLAEQTEWTKKGLIIKEEKENERKY